MATKKKIFVVDDSETSLYLIRAIFEDDQNIDIHIEKDSRQALKQLKDVMPDLLILDLMMPVIDGFQLLEKIKSDPSINSIPVIVISAKQDSATISKTMNLKVAGYLAKPVIVKDLKLKVSSLLNLQISGY